MIFCIDTLCCISLGRYCFGLETRVIIKFSTHPCYPLNMNWFLLGRSKRLSSGYGIVVDTFLPLLLEPKFWYQFWNSAMTLRLIGLCMKKEQPWRVAVRIRLWFSSWYLFAGSFGTLSVPAWWLSKPLPSRLAFTCCISRTAQWRFYREKVWLTFTNKRIAKSHLSGATILRSQQ